MNWYAATVPSSKESRIADIIRKATSLEVFQPKEHVHKRIRRPSNARQKVARPILPRIVFLGLQTPSEWLQLEPLRRNHTINGFVLLNGSPYMFPQAAIDWLRGRDMGDVLDNPIFHPARVRPQFQIGQLVRPLGDGFRDYQFKVIELTPKTARILAAMSQFEMTVNLEKLEAAE